MLAWVFGNRKKKSTLNKAPRPSYDTAKQTVATGTVKQRVDLASYEDMDPEILYYLTGDQESSVRLEVAKNDGSPLQADVILAKDVDEDVRAELAFKIGRLLPELNAHENARLTELAFEVLDILAKDNLPRVRQIISEEIKLLVDIPESIVNDLARDVEEAVAAPVLEYSPLLSDQALIQIIASGVQGQALSAIARRDGLQETISEAVVDTDQEKSIAELLANETSSISAKTLDAIGLAASDKPTWHRPLVERGNLSMKTLRRIATFVSASLVERLIARNKLLPDIEKELRQAVRVRIEAESEDVLFDETGDIKTPVEIRVQELFDEDKLTEETILDAIDEGDYALIPHALHLLSGLTLNTASKMLKSDSGKAVVSLCWKAKIEMSTAVSIQRLVARVKTSSQLKATKNGDYPLSPGDMEWYIDYFAK